MIGIAFDGHVLKLLESLPRTSFHENGAAEGTAVGDSDGESDGAPEGASLGAIDGESEGAIPNKKSPMIPSTVSNFLRPFKNFLSRVGSTSNFRSKALLSRFTTPFFLVL